MYIRFGLITIVQFFMDELQIGPIIFENKQTKAIVRTATLNGKPVIYKQIPIKSSDQAGYTRSMNAYLNLSGEEGCTGVCKLLSYEFKQSQLRLIMRMRMIMETCGIDLFNYIKTAVFELKTESDKVNIILKIAIDILSAIMCLNKQKPPLVHGDIKLENITIEESADSGVVVAKLIDFDSIDYIEKN